MNSTSACDRGGSVALVDGGSVLLGLPGALGCTTTGFAGSVCCERAVEQKTLAEALAASNMPHSTADFTFCRDVVRLELGIAKPEIPAALFILIVSL